MLEISYPLPPWLVRSSSLELRYRCLLTDSRLLLPRVFHSIYRRIGAMSLIRKISGKMIKGRSGAADKHFKRQRPKKVRREESQKAERTGNLP